MKRAAWAMVIASGWVLAAHPVRADKWDDALKDCDQTQDLDLQVRGCTAVIEVIPTRDAISLYNNRGLAYTDKREFEKAISDFTQIIAINPSHMQAYLNRGNAYLKSGAFQTALADYNKVIEIDPGYADGYFNRAIVYRLMAEREKAIADYRHAIALAPDVQKFKDGLASLEQEMTPPQAPAAPPPAAPPPPHTPAPPAAPPPPPTPPPGGGGGPGIFPEIL